MREARCMVMRGGTSKGLFFLASDLPQDTAARDDFLLAAMGSPDGRQIDGMGGGDSLTSKVAVVSPSSRPDADVNYLFLQVVVDQARVDPNQNCGNMLAGVGPFALERDLVAAREDATLVRVHMLNTASLATATVRTPGGRVTYEGAARIDGVPGTAAPVMIGFDDIAGSTCGALLPTGNSRDVVEGVVVTCIDNGMPVVLIRAADLGRTGYESPAVLDADAPLKAKVEALRLACGPLMNLGDVSAKTVPKMCLIAPPRIGGAISTRSFIPKTVHKAIGVLGAVSVATACALPDSNAAGVAHVPAGEGSLTIVVEHPTGSFTVELALESGPEGPRVTRSALLRTARKLMDGMVFAPEGLSRG